MTLPAPTRMGAVHLAVADLERSVAFYDAALGLRASPCGPDAAALSAGGDVLLVLTERPGAAPADGFCGLFHFALLVPERLDLARWLTHAARSELPLTGLSDHFVSEAIYLRDPDHHGIEIYRDRPRALWDGQVAQRMTTEPLDVPDLLRDVDGPAGLPEGTVMGHVHLRVAAIPETTAFYADLLGFEEMAAYGRQATFLGAGGYHHHVGANTWESAGRPPAPDDTARLERMTILLPDAASLAAVAERAGGTELRDPSGNPVVLAAA